MTNENFAISNENLEYVKRISRDKQGNITGVAFCAEYPDCTLFEEEDVYETVDQLREWAKQQGLNHTFTINDEGGDTVDY